MEPKEEVNELGVIVQPEILVHNNRMVELIFHNGVRMGLDGSHVSPIGENDTIMLDIANTDAYLFESVEARMLNKLSGEEVEESANPVFTLVSVEDNIIMYQGNQFKFESLGFNRHVQHRYAKGIKEITAQPAPDGCLRGELKALRFQVTLHKESKCNV